MRLQLITIVVLSLVAHRASAEDVAVDARGSLYHDSDHTTIGTSTVAVRGTVADLVTIKGRYLADVITSASVDVTSAATERFDEIRHEGEGGITYADGTTTANGTYIYSTENDWSSHTIAAGFGQDFFQHQLTLGLGGSVVLNAVERQDDDTFAERLTNFSGTASATIVGSKNDLVSLAYTFTYALGFQASPYRFAYLVDPTGTGLTLGTPESHPERRQRHALAVRYHRYLFKNAALRSHGRVYLDDWGVRSLTLGSELAVAFPPLELGLRVRGYIQSEAEFYESVYAERRRFMTADRELGAFVDGFFGGMIGVRHHFVQSAIESVKAQLRVDGFIFDYFDFPRLPNRHGLVAELGAGMTF